MGECLPFIDLNDLYKLGSFTGLLLKSNQLDADENINQSVLNHFERAIKTRFLCTDAYEYLYFLRTLCQHDFKLKEEMNPRMALMCHYDFWQKAGAEIGFSELQESLQVFNIPALKNELSDFLTLLLNKIQYEQNKMPGLPGIPLSLHARYAREQILVAFGASTFDRQAPAREGVLELKDQNIELLFVTLNKNEKQFSPTTMYHDYAINQHLFHWQSQNSARPDRGKGAAYIQHRQLKKRLFLFVREQTKDEYNRTMGFVNFGEVEYVSHIGSQPMNITWRLKTPMPPFMWHQAAKLAVG